MYLFKNSIGMYFRVSVKNFLFYLGISLYHGYMHKQILSIGALLLITPLLIVGVASAAKPTGAGSGKPDGGGGSVYLGNDISYPQCGARLPSQTAFAIIGVNGGLATKTNPCLADQLAWAGTSAIGGTSQTKIQLYVNTANPYDDYDVYGTSWDSWPTSIIDPLGNIAPNPYVDVAAGETCDGQKVDSLACAWQYGWNRAVEAANDRFIAAAEAANISSRPSEYVWWLDVETGNSWRSGDDYRLRTNVADLEGAAAYYQSIGATVGLYSTTYQWGVITGNLISAESNLNGLGVWYPVGAVRESTAVSACSNNPLTAGGSIVMTQFIKKNLDYDYSCVN